VLIDFGDPQRHAAQRVDRVDICACIAEIRRPAVAARADDDGRSNGLACFELPVLAPAFGVERIDFSILAPDERAPTENRRLRDRSGGAPEAEGPFQFEASNIGGSEPSHVRWLKSMLRRTDAPAVPMRPVQRIGEGCGAIVWTGAARRRASGGLLRPRID
jgi:hypothetical protein